MRLSRWHRVSVLAALAAVALTGLVWYVLHDLVGRRPDDLQRDLMVAHGVTSFLALMAFGSLLPLHLPAGWRWKRNRVSGVAAVVTLAALSISALLLYYAGEEWQAWARLVHIVVGLASMVVVPLHVVLGRRDRRHWPNRFGRDTAG